MKCSYGWMWIIANWSVFQFYVNPWTPKGLSCPREEVGVMTSIIYKISTLWGRYHAAYHCYVILYCLLISLCKKTILQILNPIYPRFIYAKLKMVQRKYMYVFCRHKCFMDFDQKTCLILIGLWLRWAKWLQNINLSLYLWS